MSALIVFYIECPHCEDAPAECRTLAVDQPEENGDIRIDVEMSVSQTTFTCVKCGCSFYTGDVEAEDEAGGDCPDADDDEEEEDSELSIPAAEQAADLTEFRVTFGAEPHALFPEARPDSWVTILAPDRSTARLIAINHLGTQWCDMYDLAGGNEVGARHWAETFPGRELARWSE